MIVVKGLNLRKFNLRTLFVLHIKEMEIKLLLLFLTGLSEFFEKTYTSNDVSLKCVEKKKLLGHYKKDIS